MLDRGDWIDQADGMARGDVRTRLELARKHGTKIAYSFSDGFLVANFSEPLKQIVTTYADLVFANELEAAA